SFWRLPKVCPGTEAEAVGQTAEDCRPHGSHGTKIGSYGSSNSQSVAPGTSSQAGDAGVVTHLFFRGRTRSSVQPRFRRKRTRQWSHVVAFCSFHARRSF